MMWPRLLQPQAGIAVYATTLVIVVKVFQEDKLHRFWFFFLIKPYHEETSIYNYALDRWINGLCLRCSEKLLLSKKKKATGREFFDHHLSFNYLRGFKEESGPKGSISKYSSFTTITYQMWIVAKYDWMSRRVSPKRIHFPMYCSICYSWKMSLEIPMQGYFH